MPGQSGIESKLPELPVFTSPQQQITFYADDPLSFKQILTIYNPYDFLVKFRISCTDCNKYTVSASQGYIKSNHSIDIVVHHKAVFPSNIGITDTIRVQLGASGQAKAGGKKELTITLLSTAPRERASPPYLDPKRFQILDSDSTSLGHSRQNPLLQEKNKSKVVLYATIFSVCAVLLALPLEGERTSWSEYVYIPEATCNFKLLVAFIAGIFLGTLFPT